MPEGEVTEPSAKEIREQLQRLLQTGAFRRSPRARDFLRYVVEETISGNGARLDQYTIGIEALGRGKNFSPSEDPSVRMQATRVRRILEIYYLTEGIADPVVMSLPLGRYIPDFVYRSRANTGPANRVRESSCEGDWPTILLKPVRNRTGDSDHDYLADGIVADLALEFSRYSGVRVFLDHEPDQGDKRVGKANKGGSVSFELVGSLSEVGGQMRLSIHLVRIGTGEQLWADRFVFSTDPEAVAAIRSELPHRVAACVAEEEGAIARLARSESDSMMCCASIYDTLLRGYHAERNVSRETHARAIEELGAAVEAHPGCAVAWAILSRLWSTYYSFELGGKPEGIDHAIECGWQAVRLRPEDMVTRTALAYAFLLDDQVDECIEQVEIALRFHPSSPYFRDAVGYLLALSGDWERGVDLCRRAIEENPFPRLSVYCALWLDAVRREDYREAILHADFFNYEGCIWTPVMRVVARTLRGEPGDSASVRTEVDRLLQYKPDFETCGGRLIGKYVKSPDLRSRIDVGLARAGVNLRSLAAS